MLLIKLSAESTMATLWVVHTRACTVLLGRDSDAAELEPKRLRMMMIIILIY